MAYTYSQAALKYRDSAGRFVSDATVNQVVDFVIRGASGRMVALSQQLQAGTLSLSEWQERMTAEMKSLHVGAAAVGRGGWRQMSQADWGWTGYVMRTQYGFLRNFSQDIATGHQPLDGRLLSRTMLYAESARGTQRAMVRRMAQMIGRSEERNVLGAADRHCAACMSCTSQGWVPIGTLPAIGSRTCVSRCRCSMRYRETPVAEAA